MDIYQEIINLNNQEYIDLLKELSNIYCFTDVKEGTEVIYSEYLSQLEDEKEPSVTSFIDFVKENIEIEKEISNRTKLIMDNPEEALVYELDCYVKGLENNYYRKLLIPSFYTVSKMCYAVFSSFGLFTEDGYRCEIEEIDFETVLNENMEEGSFVSEDEVLDFYPIETGWKIKIEFNKYVFNCKVISVKENTKKLKNAYIKKALGASLIPEKAKLIKDFVKGKIDKNHKFYYELNDAVNGSINIDDLNDKLKDQIDEYYYTYEVEPFEE